jgi:formylglycine-generating enzyme required for sulfatase activity
MAASTTQLMDFTLGFTEADKAWAEWIIWVLESAGYTIEQIPSNRIEAQTINGSHLIIFLSNSYQDTQKLVTNFLNDQQNHDRRVLPIQLEPNGKLIIAAAVTPVHLINCDRTTAKQRLLEAARSLPLPFNPPPQPPFRKPQPPFPGQLQGLIQTKHHGQAQGYIEPLNDSVRLEMMQLPGGIFTMGAPEGEEGSSSDERPTHRVTVQPFCMGRYPVTQAQWRFVAGLPQISRELDPDPARFKGGDRPIERVSWLQAIEFCARLSQHTGREYRLPTEAEWEYACRGKTTTPFHFGEIIDPEVANYDGNRVYGQGRKGVNREETTPVGSFKVANAFGLSDIHGNVWEWCMDHWHEIYEGAPSDGSAWIDAKAKENARRVLRGGSWDSSPTDCRSASRVRYHADNLDNLVGFRLVFPARILP